MAVEAKRGCGYRKEGGLYLVGGGLSAPCDRMPYPLDRCKTCGGGIKFTRGPQWLQPDFFTPHDSLVAFRRETCLDESVCPVCVNGGPDASLSVLADDLFGPHLLLWIGRANYTPESYLKESRELGVSRRIPAIPKGLVLGETWVLLAHLDAEPAKDPKVCARCGMSSSMHVGHPDFIFKGDGPVSLTINGETHRPCENFQAPKSSPGIFCAFVPRAVELILKESDATPERLEKEAKRGVTVVTVPDGDKDHQGSVWDGVNAQEELPGVPS